MNTTKLTKLLLGLFLIGMGNSGVAQEGPPEIPANPGVPGLLAEITELEQELTATETELEATETALTATQGELTSTQTSLAATQTDLQLTQSDLNVTSALLDETLNVLEREQNRYRVPQTGQLECWGAPTEHPDDAHSTIPCSSTGQDGEYDAGLAPPLNRFVDNGDGTITDKFTELVWFKDASCLNDHSWEQAANFAKLVFGSTGICGLNDQSPSGAWRLPNVRELMSLLDFRSAGFFSGDALPEGHPFAGFVGWYWTSTTYALPSNFDVSGPTWNCFTRQYGSDNKPRFNEAYVVNVNTGELIHTPKQDRDTISRRHSDSAPGSCPVQGFDFGTGPVGLPLPNLIAVRDLIE